ncbi:HDIG domain-containing protein [bacterium]|nr:HDIG domain-containing protein [bacterium]
MIKLNFKERFDEITSSSNFRFAMYFILFTVAMTFIISSQNFFFQKVVENGISKKDVIAEKTIVVIDTKKTERQRKEVESKIEPVLTTAEDDFIKTNLNSLENSIKTIREKDTTRFTKQDELSVLFDISDENKKLYVVNYLLNSNSNDLKDVFEQAKLTLTNLLATGITEKDTEKGNLQQLIQKHFALNLTKHQNTIVTALLEQVIVPNMVVDEIATDIAKKNARNSVKPYEVVFEKGDKILFEGEPVTKLKRDALRQAGYSLIDINFLGILGIYIFIAFTTFIFIKFKEDYEKRHPAKTNLAIVAVLSLFVALISVMLPTGFSPYILPFPAFIIILSIFSNSRLAFLATLLLLCNLTLGLHFGIEFIISFVLILLVAEITVSKIKFSRRSDLIKVGFYVSLTGLVVVSSVYLLEKFLIDIDNVLIVRDAIMTMINGILSAVIALGVMPMIESAFRVTTPYGLAELVDHNQPLLKRLQMEAPGTYHHSLLVSNLCEAAAEAIGADPTIARAGALYHDIGKLKRPLFFVENQSSFGIENPHTKLNPKISKTVIISHTKDGIELAKEYNLPPIIQDFILQHHGNGLASYFYNRAVQEEGAENIKEEQFRYPGPKPKTKEAAILMIADATESAVRSLKTPTSEEIDIVIEKIITERINDGQLSDSPLTLKDLKTIASTFSRIIRGMQHERIKYQNDIDKEVEKAKLILPDVIDKELDDKIKSLEKDKNDTDN